MPGGAPKGNRNNHNATLIKQAFKRALARKHGSVSKGLEALATKVVNRATGKAGPSATAATDQIFDRLAGKATQVIDGTVDHTHHIADADDLEQKLARSLESRLGEPAGPSKPPVH